MLATLLLGGIYYFTHYFEGAERLTKMKNPSISRQRAPEILRDDPREKSFAANQWHNDVRAPYGSNPKSGTVTAPEFINWPLYRTHYRSNLHTMCIKNQDWRLDPNMNSPQNNYSNYHMAEPYEFLINNSQKLSTPYPDFSKTR